jgi:hypothetical protein
MTATTINAIVRNGVLYKVLAEVIQQDEREKNNLQISAWGYNGATQILGNINTGT